MAHLTFLKFINKGRLLSCPLFILSFVFSGCVNLQAPRHEFNLARTAYLAAKENDAPRYSPNLFHKSERYFKRAQQLFKDRRYDKSTTYFRKSRYYAERAENVARLKQFKQGEMVP